MDPDKSNLSNRTEILFQNKFHKKLFLEDNTIQTCLCDVYIEPRLIERSLSNSNHIEPDTHREEPSSTNYATAYINKFISSSHDKVLFIEGVAGAGKSSLFCKMSTTLYGKDIFYKSLKDYLYKDRIQLREELIRNFSLNDNDYDKILLLDGLDEIWSKIDADAFEDDLRFFIERNYKVIFTLRPGYVPYSKYKDEVLLCTLTLFGIDEKMQWLNKYKFYRGDNLSNQTVTNILADTRFLQITSIPIMLYIIANRDIDIRSITSMPSLYEQVFNSLKVDKASTTKKKLENDYLIAQRLAFIMQAKGVLTISRSEVDTLLVVNDSFYSSVYMDKIIEGEVILEFVHKTIQEFFAAKWIYSQIRRNDFMKWTLILSSHIFSDEILSNLRFFFNSNEFYMANLYNQFVCSNFPYLSKNICNWKQYKRYIRNIIINTQNIYTQITNSVAEITECEDISAYFDIIKLLNENNTTAYKMQDTKYTRCIFSHLLIRLYNFYATYFDNCQFMSCVFEYVSFFQCSFSFYSQESDIVFRRCQFNNVRFLANNKNSIRFENCTFVLYDPNTVRETALEIQKCTLDDDSLNNLKQNVEYYTKEDICYS